ncbi:MAG: hypothetical protein ACRCYY_06235 [Trueperaceae bacterium]
MLTTNPKAKNEEYLSRRTYQLTDTVALQNFPDAPRQWFSEAI